MLSNINKVEKWILDAIAIEHLSKPRSGLYGDLIWNKRTVLDRIPPHYLNNLTSSNDISNILCDLIKKQWVSSWRTSSFNEPQCIVNDETIFQFKKIFNSNFPNCKR